MTDKLDIFDVLKRFNQHDVEFFANLTDDQNKQIHPFVLQRWLTGTSNDLQVQLVNEYSNTKVFEFAHHHRSLAWYLLLASTVKSNTRYSWMKTAGKRTTTQKPVSAEVIRKTYPHYSVKESIEALEFYDVDNVTYLAEMLGYQESDLKLIAKEFRPTKAK